MHNTRTPPHKPLNYVLDDLPPSPAACPILGQQRCRERGRKGQKRGKKKEGCGKERKESRRKGKKDEGRNLGKEEDEGK